MVVQLTVVVAVKHSNNLVADDNTLAAGGLLLVNVLVLGGAVLRVLRVAAAGATTVELDAVTSAGDAEAFAGAAGAGRADAGGAGAVGGAAGEGWDIRVIIGVIRVHVLLGKAAVELLKGGLVVLGVDDLAGLAGALGLGGSDARGRKSAALGNGTSRGAAGLAVR